MALDSTVENIRGNLRDAYKAAVPGTVRCVDQLMQERRVNPELRKKWVYAADGAIYFVDNKKLMWAITREAQNPILQNIDEAFDALIANGNYSVKEADLQTALNAPETVLVDILKLNLDGDDDQFRYLAVDTSRALGKYNAESQKVLQRVFGPSEEDYSANMSMLKEEGIKETKIYILHPAVQQRFGPVARASWLNTFNGDSSFEARDRFVDIIHGVRGVRRLSLADAYTLVVGSQKELNDAQAIGLLQVATAYFAAKQ